MISVVTWDRLESDFALDQLQELIRQQQKSIQESADLLEQKDKVMKIQEEMALERLRRREEELIIQIEGLHGTIRRQHEEMQVFRVGHGMCRI